jgi:hypothetical protein
MLPCEEPACTQGGEPAPCPTGSCTSHWRLGTRKQPRWRGAGHGPRRAPTLLHARLGVPGHHWVHILCSFPCHTLVPHLQQGVLPRGLTGLPVEERHLQQVGHRHLVVQHQVPAPAAQQVTSARGSSGGAGEQAREEREAGTREGQASCGLRREGETATQAGHRGGRKEQVGESSWR